MELLVTIGILALLSALLLPALSRAKTRAKTASCKNNLRQMGKALAMYEGDYRYYPGAGDCAVSTNQWPYLLRSTNSWIVRIGPYFDSSRTACGRRLHGLRRFPCRMGQALALDG
jgi:type II secretory pathway pseudopilin PulG